MATRVTVRFPLGQGPPARPVTTPGDGAAAVSREAFDVFAEVDRACTRFDARSPLMRANGSPDEWHTVPCALYQALLEAAGAHEVTDGLFDPRVLRHLVGLGYDHTLPFHEGNVTTRPRTDQLRPTSEHPWRPGFRPGTQEVRIGPEPVDLGGIGKGLAVRWAAKKLSRSLRSFLVEAGGDMYCSGDAPGGGPWMVGVEDPSPGLGPLCVLALRDRAVTTSSVRLRRWRAGGRRAHHLIDPRRGVPGGEGLLSVTVVGEDPAMSEVWSKALFLAGARRIGAQAWERHLPALWVGEDGNVGMTLEMKDYVTWLRR